MEKGHCNKIQPGSAHKYHAAKPLSKNIKPGTSSKYWSLSSPQPLFLCPPDPVSPAPVQPIHPKHKNQYTTTPNGSNAELLSTNTESANNTTQKQPWQPLRQPLSEKQLKENTKPIKKTVSRRLFLRRVKRKRESMMQKISNQISHRLRGIKATMSHHIWFPG